MENRFRDFKYNENLLRKSILRFKNYIKILEALELAKRAHEYQKRNEGDPYVIHVIRVANDLIRLGINDDKAIISALLHDTIEDTNTSYEDINRKFGKEVADSVLLLTRDKNLESKSQAFNKIIKFKGVALIKACDILDNMRSMVYRMDRGDRWKRHLLEAKDLSLPFIKSFKNKWLTDEFSIAYKKVNNMKKNNQKILITGSSGTIGTRLFETLLGKGYEVVGFDKKENKWHKSLNDLTILGDLLVENDVKKIPTDIDLIIHLAANARVYDLVVDPNMALDNIKTTYNILDFARKNKIKRIIFSSSREVYGNRKKIIAKESDVDLQLCESAYSASKISDEVLVYSFSKCYEMDYIVCRFSNVYGMYDESERFVPLMLRDIKNNVDVNIFGKDKVLDFTYIDDCVAGVVKCVENFNKAKNNIFNIANGKGSNLKDVAVLIKKMMKSKSKIILGKSRTGEVVKYVANISKAKKNIGYSPKFNLKEGLNLSIDWYKKNNAI